MEIKIQLVIDAYKEELNRLMNENILLKAQLKQIQNEMITNENYQNNEDVIE